MSWNMLAGFGQALGLREIDMVNLSSINATLKLMQCSSVSGAEGEGACPGRGKLAILALCRRLGLFSLSVRDKLHRPDAMRRAAGDLSEAQFIQYKRVFDEMERRLGEASQERWTALMYNWELYPGASMSTVDMGNFVFVNGRLDKYLLVQVYGDECNGCGKPHQASYNLLVTEVAQRFLNLTSYLRDVRTPQWVRATYTSPEQPLPAAAFFDFDDLSPPRRHPTESLILHLTRDDLAPSLREKDCDLIDAVVYSLGGLSLSRDAYLMPKDAPPPLTVGREKLQRVCSGCEQMFPLDNLFRCGGCKLEFYCSRDCQKGNWLLHRRACKASKR